MRLWTRAVLVGAVGLGAGGALGCAEERAPINRVQNNALAKSFFVGEDLASDQDNPEFFAQGTVVDVGYGAAQDGLFTSTYAQPVSRIKWQITEDLLIGRLAYERIEDSDGKKGTGNPAAEGQIAYIYPIISHFDVRRDYNSQTGEESNVIVENTTDQTWDKRAYMRVDWSRNLNTNAYDYDTLSLIGIYGGVSYEPVSYYVNDPDHADHPEFNVEDGYFDVTNKALASPGVVDLSHLGWGIDSFPACYLENDFFGGSAPAGNCNPVELTIRQAFKKVVDDDFEPQDWDGRRFQAFGAFYVERNGYARDYGMVDDKWHRFISRYNIWERSHYYAEPESMSDPIECNTPETTPYGADPTRDDDGNGTHDECEAVTAATDFAGSRCDQFTHKCTLPYQARVQKPVVWHYTKNSHQDYFEGTEWAAHEWDVALRVAVQAAKYAECTRTNAFSGDGNADGLDDVCQSKFPVYSGQQDDNQDAINLAREVDDCRNGLAHGGEDCESLAGKMATDRGYTQGVVDIANMGEMVVLCHGPVEAKDPAVCGDKRLPADISAADCDREWNSEEPDQEIVAQCNAAKSVRIGDLRYHQVNVIKHPQTPSPWGIYTDAEDPLSGNKIAASINVWSHVNDLWSRGVVDMVRYIQGELPVEEITDGKYIGDWVAADEAARRNGVAGTITAKQRDERVMAAAWQGARGVKILEDKMPSKDEMLALKNLKVDAANAARKPFRSPRELKPLLDRLKTVRADSRSESVDRPVYDARRIAAQNTPTEAAIQTPAMQQLAGVDNANIPAEDISQFTSIFRGLNPTIRRDIRQAKENALAARGACMMQEAPAPNSMVGLANVLTQKFGAWQDIPEGNEREALYERMQTYLAQRAQYAVIIHEMGHSVGLRHNFVSSSNAWGYRPQYWQLRTKNGNVTAECHDVTEDGNTCVGARYFDPPTSEENDQLIHMFMQSSVMDYAGENTQDMIGLGAYDFAAARMFYGEVMSVHAAPDYAIGGAKSKGILNITDSFGGIVGYQHLATGGAFDGRECSDNSDCDVGPFGPVGRTCELEPQSGKNMCKLVAGEFMHYSQLNKEYGLINNCQPVGATWEEVEAKFKPAYWNEAKHGRWHPVVDGQIVQVDGVYSRCRQQPVDYVAYDRMRAATDAEADSPAAAFGFNFYGGGRAVDNFGRTRVPYAFATDSWADLGNLAVYRHDNGADAYELFNFFITEQETRHIFDNYRRGRQGYSVRSASGRLLWRYNEKMRDGAKGLGLYFNLFRDQNEMPYEEQILQLTFLFPDNLLASGLAFDHFTRQIQRPQSGQHASFQGVMRSKDRGEYETFNSPVALVIPDGATGYFGNVGVGGKLVENRLADDQGEYDRDYTMNAGSYYDKVYAPYLLSESVDNFISDSLDDFVDPRYRSVSMAGMFPEGYRRLLANMMTRDDATRGVFVTATASGAPEVNFQSKVPNRPLGWTSWWTPESEVCFPGANTLVCDTPQLNAAFGEAYPFGPGEFEPYKPERVIPVDSEVDWEQWKFLVVQTLLYLPENQRNEWLNQLGIWEIGADDDPGFENRIEFHSPEGRIYVARTYGREEIFGKTVQRGIAARILEQANEFVIGGYETTVAGPGVACTDDCVMDLDGDGVNESVAGTIDEETGAITVTGTIWYVPVIENGAPVRIPAEVGSSQAGIVEAAVNNLQEYEPLLTFIRQSLNDFHMADPTMKGLYD